VDERVHTELQRTVASLRSVFAAAACSCALVEDDGASLRFAAADGAGADLIVGVPLPVTRGIAGWAAMSGEPIAVSDVDRDTRFARDVAESTNYVPRTILAAPIDSDGEVLGVLEVLDPRTGGSDTGHDLAVLGLVASQLAVVLRWGEEASDDPLEQLIAHLRSGPPGLRETAQGVLEQLVRGWSAAQR
jgi:GAF domain-containing protein